MCLNFIMQSRFDPESLKLYIQVKRYRQYFIQTVYKNYLNKSYNLTALNIVEDFSFRKISNLKLTSMRMLHVNKMVIKKHPLFEVISYLLFTYDLSYQLFFQHTLTVVASSQRLDFWRNSAGGQFWVTTRAVTGASHSTTWQHSCWIYSDITTSRS